MGDRRIFEHYRFKPTLRRNGMIKVSWACKTNANIKIIIILRIGRANFHHFWFYRVRICYMYVRNSSAAAVMASKMLKNSV